MNNTANTAETLPSDAARLVLVDASGYIFRAYFAIKQELTAPDGTPVKAVLGYTNMLLKLREQFAHDCLCVINDASRISFRQEIYPEYKAHRPPAPEDLVPQFPLVREATKALNIPCVELEGYEADDLIATYACEARKHGLEVVIVSSDKDLMQLIAPGVSMLDPMKQKYIGEAEVLEKFGVTPDKVIEVQSLIGDPTDNVPGVPSIGPKTAAELINQFGTLEGVLANLDQIKQPKRREVLTQYAEAARISHKLVTLTCEAPIPVPIADLDIKPMESATLLAFLERMGFSSVIKRLGLVSASAPQGPMEGKLTTPASSPSRQLVPKAPGALPVPVVDVQYETIRDEETLARWIAEAMKEGVMAVDTETTSLNAVEAELVGVSLATKPGKAAYIPLAHVVEVAGAATGGQSSLFESAPTTMVKALAPNQLPRERALELLKPLFTHPAVLKVGHNLKYDLVVLNKYGVTIAPLGDTMLMSYCLSAGLHGQGMDFLAEHHLQHKTIKFTDVVGTGKAQKLFSEVDIEAATAYAAEDSDITLRLYEHLKNHLPQQRVAGLYETIERPLVPVIAAMEVAGIAVDTKTLGDMSHEFAGKMVVLEKEIIELAGMEFSVASPKQLGEVLFDKLQLPGGKKSSKTGAYTTDAEALEALEHPIAAKVLEWRQFAKLKSTYTDALAESISSSDHRVHTCYSMAITSTGRLSSSDPNLQNIPIRTEEGKRIRTAFIATPGNKLISADYSQIELRLLAHVADIPVLKDAFRNGTDIHAVTASQMFGVPVEAVDGELRRRAKTINFGIIYGISAHGLATRLGIGRAEAADYIGKYFAQYPGIREYMDRTIEFARAHGYVETLYGRKVFVRGINDKNGSIRQFSERAAINAPLQGTAADIIKRAMIAVDTQLANTPARMLLQVHDELVIEGPENMADELAPRIKRTMEQVAALSVPLTVEVGVGAHWGEIH
jgi:DNA polymerase-1